VCGVEVKEEVEVRGSKRSHAQNVKIKQLTITSNNNITTGMWFYTDTSETEQVKTLHCNYDVRLTLHCNYDVKYETTFDDVKYANMVHQLIQLTTKIIIINRYETESDYITSVRV
jgi:hypothetical protein